MCYPEPKEGSHSARSMSHSVHSEPKPRRHKHETGSMELHFDPRFQLPFTALLLGARGSGKSLFVKQVIQNMEHTLSRLLDRIIWCYSSYQPMYDELAESVNLRFIEGIPESLTDESIVVDDCMDIGSNHDELMKALTMYRHHRTLSVIFLV